MSAARNVVRRRGWLAGMAALGMATGLGAVARVSAQPAAASAASSRTRVILLGTKGGPRVGGERSNPANVLLIQGVPYVVDCGQGVARQLVRAGIPLDTVRHVFITHMHSDHNLEYGGLLYSAWAAGLRYPVHSWGPPGLEAMTGAFMDYMGQDIQTRIHDEGKPDLRGLVIPHEFSRSGELLRNEHVTVTAARNEHPPIHHSYALRFDAADRSVVFSGDTARSDAVVELAKGADVLVHEAMYLPGVEAMVKRVPNAATLREHLLASHIATEELGRVAAAAGVKTLVLSHFVPGDDPGISDEMWALDVRKHFKGEIVVGRDLMVI